MQSSSSLPHNPNSDYFRSSETAANARLRALMNEQKAIILRTSALVANWHDENQARIRADIRAAQIAAAVNESKKRGSDD